MELLDGYNKTMKMKIVWIPVDKIDPGPFQLREYFDEGKINELAKESEDKSGDDDNEIGKNVPNRH